MRRRDDLTNRVRQEGTPCHISWGRSEDHQARYKIKAMTGAITGAMLPVVLIATGFVAGGISVCFADSGEYCATEAYQLALDDIRSSHGLAGLAVGLSFDSGCEWYGASGLANIDTGRAFEPDDYFRVASITKTFTATVVLQLMEEGALGLEDTLAEWMPEYPDWSAITIRQLLSHTSGIHDVTNDPDSGYSTDQLWEPSEVIALAATYPLDFEPGTDYRYCNVNYQILGLIIEAATGDTWASQVRLRVLDPVDLSDTFIESDETIPGGLQVRGYWNGSEDITDNWLPSNGWGDGSMVSTTADLTHFAHALFRGDLLLSATLEEMVTPPPLGLIRGSIGDYGLAYGHGGHVWGFTSLFGFFEDHSASYALFTNESNTDRWALSSPVFGLMFPTTYAVAASAHQPGAAGTSWITDAVLFNSGLETVYAELRYHPAGRDNSAAEGFAVAVEPLSSLVLGDLVAATLNHAGSSGAVLVIASAPLVITSRTYNDDADGTFGQFIPAVPEERWIMGTDPVTLLQLTGTGRYRTNIGFANLGAEALDVTVDLVAADAGTIDTLTATLQPYSYDQLNNVFAGKAVVEDAYAVVRAGSEEARYLAYASVVDNNTGDPTFVAPVEAGSDVLYVPAAAHVGGVGGTNWRTDLELYSAGDVEAIYRVEWLPADQANLEPLAESFTLGSGECVRYGDVAREVFGASGAGALRITVDEGQVMATSRTYNDLGDRTYGQAVPGLTLGHALAENERARIAGLAYSADPQQGYRTNIGLVNATGEEISVRLYVYGGDSSLIGIPSFTLEPYAFVQETDIFAGFTDEDVTGGRVEVSSTSSGAQYYAWASVVDNRSGDPVFIPAEPPGAE